MRIGHFSESYLPYLSGVTISIDTLIKELRKLGHEIHIFAPHHPKHGDTDPNIYRFPSIRTHYPGFRLAIPFSRKILKKIPSLNLDIIHTHSPYQTGILSMVFAKSLKIPIVYTFHTLFAQYLHYVPLLPKGLMKHLLSRYIRAFCSRCDCIIVPSRRTKILLLEEGIKSRIEVVPSGVDLDLVQKFSGEGIRKKYKIPSEAKVLLYVGRLSKEKNLPFLFRAFKRVQIEIPDAYLLIVAGGPMEKTFKKEAKHLGIAANTIFTHEVKFPEVFDYYKAADIFVFSSLTETQGLVLAEAKACGLPSVAINFEGVSEMIEDGVDGFLTDESEEEFGMRVIQLLMDIYLRDRMSSDARKRAPLFSSTFMAKRVEEIYSSLLNKV